MVIRSNSLLLPAHRSLINRHHNRSVNNQPFHDHMAKKEAVIVSKTEMVGILIDNKPIMCCDLTSCFSPLFFPVLRHSLAPLTSLLTTITPLAPVLTSSCCGFFAPCFILTHRSQPYHRLLFYYSSRPILLAGYPVLRKHYY